MKKKLVVIGLLGQNLDRSRGKSRWEKWRPTVSLFMHEDLLADRFELLSPPKDKGLADKIIDDIHSVSPETKVNWFPVEFNDPWEFEEVYEALYAFAANYKFKHETEDYLIHISTGTHVAQICLFILTESNYFPGRLIQTSPPKKVNSREIGSYRIIDLDLSCYDKIMTRFEGEKRESLDFLKSGIKTNNKAFNKMIQEIEQVAVLSKSPILLMGPTGAGKSQLAKRIYELKKSKSHLLGNFVDVNCATLKGDTAMSTLFGHVKGAFTGAQSDRLGLLKTANEGILFLDEIGELGLDEQAVLLRAVEEKKFFPMGADQEVESEFQLIAGTNKNLFEAVQNGLFREDLLARINLWTFELPGLKDRKEDLKPNLEYELIKFSNDNTRQVSFNKEASEEYLKFALSSEAVWKGNFRDLNGSVSRMATLAPKGRIDVETVQQEISRLRFQWQEGAQGDNKKKYSNVISVLGASAAAEIDPFDLPQLEVTIEICLGSKNMANAGRQLFAVSRLKKAKSNDSDRLKKYLSKFNIDWSDLRRKLS